MSREEIKNYIKQQLEAGTSRETIEKNLQDAGWVPEDIQDAFESFDTPEKIVENVPEPVDENKIGEQSGTETREVESFGSFLKLCWNKKISRYSIILGVIICFVEVFLLMLQFPILVSPFVIIVGTWWGIREKRKDNSLKSLSINIVPIFLFLIFFVLYYFSPLFLGGYNIFTAVILPPILSLMVVYLYTIRKNIIERLKSLPKLFWEPKKARYSIVLGLIIFFVGCFISTPLLDAEQNHQFPGLGFVLRIVPVITVSSFFVVYGIGIGIKKVKKNIFLKFLFLLYIISISLILFFWFYIIFYSSSLMKLIRLIL